MMCPFLFDWYSNFDLFDNVWSCDDFGTTKTNPEIYRLVSEKLGVEIGKIFFVDDNYNADKAAKEAGMTVCGIYDNSSKDCIDEIKSVTDYYIYDFSELLKIQYINKSSLNKFCLGCFFA